MPCGGGVAEGARALPHLPPGTPKRVQPQSPGLRRTRRYPGYGREVRHNPERGSDRCPNRVWSRHDSGHSLWDRNFIRSKEADPIPPLFTATPVGTNGTTPCGVGNALRPEPGVAPGTAQPRAVWHNAFGVALIYPEKPQKPQQRPVVIGWNACCPFWTCGMIKRLSAMNSVGKRRQAWGWCRSLCRCGGCVDMAFATEGGLRAT